MYFNDISKTFFITKLIVFLLQDAIVIDQMSGANDEEEKDNERKFREEQLIAAMEEQLSKQLSKTKLPTASGILESKLPQAVGKKEEVREDSLSGLVKQTPEPHKTYYPELSLGDKNFTSTGTRLHFVETIFYEYCKRCNSAVI